MAVGLGLTLAAGAGLGFVSGLGGPGYESALIGGLVLPTLLSIASAAELDRSRPEPFDAYCRGVANGAACFAVFAVTVLAHGLRVGLCDLSSGLENLVLGPGVGLCIAGAWSVVAAEATRRIARPRRRGALRTALALGAPVGSFLVGLGRFYSSPMIFGYDPFVGYFSGTLYDTVVAIDGLRGYRIGSLLTLFAGFVFALHLAHDRAQRLVYQSVGRPGLLMLGCSAAVLTLGMSIVGPKLGHWQTKETIAESLGAVIDGGRCIVVHARSIRADEAQRFARECEAHVAASEAWLEVRGPERITAFLFESSAQKQELMGAGGTNVAKPWRAEIYVQHGDYPHKVLGHEIVHVVAASAGRGPFRIAGAVGGLLPDPGLIEGVAVAAAPKEDELSPMEWARAMRDLGILPTLDRLFGLGFLGVNAQSAYTVAGAFVGFVHDAYGAEVVRNWYGGAELPALVGKSWAELEASWHADLDKIELVDAARDQAKARFDKPGFFARKCPRVVDGCRERADDLLARGDVIGGLAELSRATALEPGNPGLRLDSAEALVAAGREGDAQAALGAIASDESLPRQLRDRAIEKLADRALALGEADDARRSYEDVAARTLEEARRRTLFVKIAGARDASLRPAVLALLVGVGSKKPDRVVAAELLGALDRDRVSDGLPAYLLARYYVDADEWEGASEHLERALARKLDVPGVHREALRLRIIAACAMGDGGTARRYLAEYAREEGVRPTRVEWTRRLVARTTGEPLSDMPRAAGQ